MDVQKSGKFLIGSIIVFIVLFGVVTLVLNTMLNVAESAGPAPVEEVAAAAEDAVTD